MVTKEDNQSVFNFETIRKFIIHVNNPLDDPDFWKWNITEMPYFHKLSEGREISFGTPQFIKSGYIYIYGADWNPVPRERFMILTRVPEDKITDFDAWEFFYRGRWQKESTKAGRLFDHFGAEYSISYQPFLQKYVTVYTENGLSDKIILRTAAKPEGPWSDPVVVYKTPEVTWDKEYFCYAAKGHPELSKSSNDLLVSYVCNAFDFFKMAADTKIYKPKFIRIKFTHDF
ncbi:DUF4185 domain-containing protein [candidate division KSB1 bacterium]